LKNCLLYLSCHLIWILNPSLGLAQHPDSLYKYYQQDVLARDSTSIQIYATYTISQINHRHTSSAQFLDSLEQMCAVSSWPKANGIFLRVKARFYDVSGNMDKALHFYNLAIDTLRMAGPNYANLSTALIGAGFVLLNTGLHKESLQTIKEAYHFAKQTRHSKNKWLALNFFGDYYYYSAFKQEQFDSALYYYLKTDSLMEEDQMSGYFKADNDLGLADVYRRLGNEKLSEKYWKRALEEAERNNNYGVIYALYVDKAEVFQEKKQFEKALELKLKAYEYVQASGYFEFIARANQHLYETYKSLGDYEHALDYYERYIAAQDSMNKHEALVRYAELQAKYESQKKEKEIVRLRNENLLQTKNSLIGLALLAGLLVGFIAWHNRKLHRKNTELKRKNREILLAQLKGQNLERKRMATELHDNLNTKIAAIRWQLEAVTPSVSEKAQSILTKTLELVDDVYGDVRLISHNLMPEKVEAMGLIHALENLLTQLKQNNKINFELVVNTKPDFQFASLTYHLYNIIFEMINNILKHAQADNGWISISALDDNILLTVSDDGVGFDIAEMTSGYGIRNITSRLENINGKWNIESSPGKGTKFFIEIPKID